jgi:hypothetical protein
LSPPKGKRKRGRKETVAELEDDIKARLSVMLAKYNVSLRNADGIAMLWMSRYVDVKQYEKMGLS